MENLLVEELSQAIHNYIKENYDFDFAEIFGEEIVYHLKNGNEIYINIDLQKLLGVE